MHLIMITLKTIVKIETSKWLLLLLRMSFHQLKMSHHDLAKMSHRMTQLTMEKPDLVQAIRCRRHGVIKDKLDTRLMMNDEP